MEKEASGILQNMEYIDLTDDFEALVKDMKLGETIHSDQFSLYDSMSGTELGDPKMDIKQGLAEADTPDSMLKEGKLKLASELSVQEMTGVIDEFLMQQLVWMEGCSLAHSIYQIGYIYDDKLYKDNKILKTFIQSLFHFGNNLFDLCRYSTYIREDDYVISIFSFPQLNQNAEKLYEQFQNCEEEEFSGKITNAKKKKTKKNLKLNEYDALYCRFQIQKIILEISEVLCEQKLNQEIIENLERKIKKGRQLLEEVVKTQDLSADMSQCRSKTIHKTLVSQISPRQFIEKTKEQCYTMIENIFNQLEFVFQIFNQKSVQNIVTMLDQIHEQPKNIFIKAFLDVTLIQNQTEIFGQVQLPQFISQEFSQLGLTQDQIQSEQVQLHLRRLTIVQLEYMLKHLKNKYRQQRELPKMHQDLSIIIHEASILDNDMFQHKPLQNQVLVVQTYDMGIKLMLRQLALGSYLKLYDQADQPQVLFYMDYLHNILEKNSTNYIQKFDKEFLQAYNNNISLEKAKKKLSDYQRIYFFNFISNKGIQYYLKALSRLTYFLLEQKCLPNFNGEEEYKNRFENRFEKIFQHVYYIKKLDYKQYIEFQEDFWKMYPEAAGLDKIKEMFKQAQDCFALIPQNDNVITEVLKQEAKKLERVCVMTSLTSMTLKMKFSEIKSIKFNFSYDNHRLYPVLEIAK